MEQGIEIRIRLDGTEPAVQAAGRVDRSFDEIRRSAERASDGGEKLGAAIRRVGTYAAGIVAGGGLLDIGRHIAATADAYANLESRLKIVTAGQSSLDAAMTQTFGIAQATRQSWESTADLYGKLARATGELGLSQQQLGGIVTTVNQAVLVSGGGAASAQAALVQLGQAFSAGTLRGEELNSILEQTPRLAQAIADGMGVSVGALRKLGEEGELTAERVSQALQRAAQGVAADFSAMAPTVAGAWTQLSNAALQYVGQSDAARSGSAALAHTMSGMAADFGAVMRAVEATSAVLAVLAGGALMATISARTRHTAALIAETTAERAAAQAAVQSVALNVALGGSTNELTAAKTRLAAAETALAAAQAQTLRGKLAAAPAIAALGGPIGAAITGVIALGAAFATLATSAEKSVDRTKSAVADEAKAIVESLQKQIDKLKERNDLMGRGLPATDQIAELSMKTGADNARLAAERDRLASQTTRTGWFGEQIGLSDAHLEANAQAIANINAQIAANNKLLADAIAKEKELTAAKEAAAGPAQAYIELTNKLRGGNAEFTKSLNVLYAEFRRLGGEANPEALRRYREEVALLVKSMSPAAKKADQEHEASLKRVGELIAHNRLSHEEQIASIRHQTSLIGKTAEQQAILNAQRKIELDLARDLAAVDREKGLSKDEKSAKKAELTAGAERAKADVIPAIGDQFKAQGEAQDEKELIARRAYLDQRVADLRQSFMTEQEIETENHATRMGNLAAWHEEQTALWAGNKEQQAAIDAQYNALSEQEMKRHQAALGNISAQGALARKRFDQMTTLQQTEVVSGILLQHLGAVARQNRAFFYLHKAGSIAHATVSTITGATKALELGPIIGPPLAAMIYAAGMANVAMIARQKFEGGGISASAPSGGGAGNFSTGGSFEPPAPPKPEQRAEVAAPKNVVNVTLVGDFFDYRTVGKLIPLINEHARNGTEVVVTTQN